MRCCTFWDTRFMVGLIMLCIGFSASLVSAQGQSWEQFQDEDTLEVLTVDSSGEEYWSTFWLVVLDGEFYLRLGSRGSDRIKGHTKMPHVSVKIGGQQFDQVKAVDAPDKAEAVATAMADKYLSDLFIRFFPHPMTVRLDPSE